MYVRNDFPQYRRHDLENFSMNDGNGRIEILAVEVTINKEKWILLSIYKQPRAKICHLIECVDNIIMQISKHDFNIVLMGDFNVNMLNRNELSDCLDFNGFSNIVKDVTCFKGQPSMIDLLITNKPKRFRDTICVDVGLSDFHTLVCTATKFHVPKPESRTFKYRTFKNFNREHFLHDLSVIPYHVMEIFDDVNDSYWLWNELTMQVINEHAPIKTKTVKGHRVPYMNGKLRRAINVKNMYKRKYDKVKNKVNWNNYRKQRNLVTKLRKNSINVYLQSKCNNRSNSQNHGKNFWETVKPFISHKCSNKNDNIILSHNGNVFSKPTDVVSIFNDYFINVAKDIGTDDSIRNEDSVISCLIKHENDDSISSIKNYMQSININVNEFSFEKIDVDVVKRFLANLKSNKATGYDMLPSKLLKIGCDMLSHSICYLVNMSFTVCSFPDALKCAEISPIYKKGIDLDVCIYRPVSILPSMSKIFEKEMVNQLSQYFEYIFSDVISGFRSKHSCETVLTRMVENIKFSLDQGKIVCVLVMDLSRAFDCIPYKLFMSKLRAYGLSMSACKLMFSYYSYRKQRVKLGNNNSEWQNVYKGSAQGSIIGPISYNIFTNDMLLLLDDDVEAYNYADDNSLACSGYKFDQIQQNLSRNVQKIMSWFDKNHMKVNPDKFNYIVFGKHDHIGDFIIGNHIIKPVKSVKLLGLNLDNKLNFESHISNLCQKAGRQIHVLARLSRILNESNKMLVYNSFVECYFNYCSPYGTFVQTIIHTSLNDYKKGH